jgi:hypothetical protein
VDADGDDDLAYGQTVSSSQVKWYVRKSNGSTLGGFDVWRNDAGDAGDLFYLSDTGGDGDADLLYGRVVSDFQVRWYGRLSSGGSFGPWSTWASDAGDEGDTFPLASIGRRRLGAHSAGSTNPSPKSNCRPVPVIFRE